MSETPEIDVDFSAIPVEEAPEMESVITPQPEESAPADIPDEVPQSAADRVRARFKGRDGTRPAGEPSTSARRASRPAKPAAKPVPGKPREGSLVKPLTELYTSVGLMLAPIDPVCSVAFIENAESCAKALETLARENETVRRVILAMTQTSAWGGVLIAHLPLLLMVMMHHGPRDIQDRVAPMAMMMNPSAMQKAAEAQAAKDERDAA
jgi:hypothetical protein